MKVQEKVLKAWKSLSRPERRMVRNRAKYSDDAGLRSRCKVVLSLVAGNGARAIASLGLCSTSQVYRVAERFVEYGPLSWSSEFICPIWVGRLADPTTRKGCKESLDQDS